jgi:hypothetical protein
MARIFDIIPVGTTEIHIQPDGSKVQRELDVMYDIEEDAEQALDLIVKPYGQISMAILDRLFGRTQRSTAKAPLKMTIT